VFSLPHKCICIQTAPRHLAARLYARRTQIATMQHWTLRSISKIKRRNCQKYNNKQLQEWKHTTCVHLQSPTRLVTKLHKKSNTGSHHTYSSVHTTCTEKHNCCPPQNTAAHAQLSRTIPHNPCRLRLHYTSMMRQLSCDVWSRCTNMVSK
jgi:hypothetical protein